MGEKRSTPEKSSIEKRFKRTDLLTRKKLKEYIPVMIMTNMSVFLLSTVDSLVAGNLVSSDALASVQILLPALMVISVISTLVSAGSGTSLSTCLGRNDVGAIQRTKSAVVTTMTIATAATAVIQVPVMYIIIRSYDLAPEVGTMVWQYAIGMMIAMPIGIISSVGSYQLTILGKMRVLMILSLGEGLVNLVMDVFFVEVTHLGIAGIGFGTACANILRCSATLIYLVKKTDMFRSGKTKARWTEVKDILYCGMPEAAAAVMVALQNYFMMIIILDGFEHEGGVIKGVCFLAYSIANIMILGFQGAMRPLIGLYVGAGDTKAIRQLVARCVRYAVTVVGILVIAMELFPELIYMLNGVKAVPEGGVLSLRLYLICLVFIGIDSLLRVYFANRKDSRFATLLTVAGCVTLPVFAILLYHFMEAPYIWLAYLMSELSIFAMSVSRYQWWVKKDQNEQDPSMVVLYLSVKPDEAIEASRRIRCFAKEKGCSKRVAYRMSLCMEEMVAYAVESQKRNDIEIQIMVKFTGDEGKFVMVDDGRCIALDENESTQTLITDNYELLKKVSKSLEYQYILNMNYTVIRL